ncbi:ABC transporter permease [Natronorubrum daqingense]|uniref:ABC-type nitrate/sulfonate/bicarbonate transport system, permease component n=1 Tax=Natronorubrum daqingense TaxID=588898 RepID=A0A1N7FYT1_9EURY|nr:ABC transporter permease [Natronorubrum daqingense]SIS05481.1 ABC-type nitrate/sulfonate/bicarbonate transport system, permease component [Natronorubrum daqingense]
MAVESRYGSGSFGLSDRANRIRIYQTLVVVGLLGTIELLPRLGLVEPTTLIPLTEMLSEIVSLTVSGELTPHIIQTFSAIFAAFALGIATGIPTGVLLWRYDSLKDILDPYLLTYYAIPVFAFYPLLIAIFGLNILPIITIAWLFSVVIIITNTASGLKEIPDIYPEVGRNLNLSSAQMFRHIYLPAATPYVFTGLKLGFIYALIGTVASEFILAENGLGWLISFSYDSFDVQTMYASMLFVILVSLVVNVALIVIERRLYQRART